MLIQDFDVNHWTPANVTDWLCGLCDDTNWFNKKKLIQDKIGGKELLMMTAEDLKDLGAARVNLQEHILESIESLRYYNYNVTTETLQLLILQLSSQARSLQRQLATSLSKQQDSSTEKTTNIVIDNNDQKNIILTDDLKIFKQNQKVSLDTLASVSAIVSTVRRITKIINRAPYSKYDDYRSMKSLLLALSIELTSTAQRDQFVDAPNKIIEKSSKALADYCDRIVYCTKDPLLIQPFQLEKVRLRKLSVEHDLGLRVKSSAGDNVHVIEKIAPLSPAKKTNKLSEGDELIQFNRSSIIGWSASNVEKLINNSSNLEDIILVVKKSPTE